MTIGMRRGIAGAGALFASGLVLAACGSSGGPDTAGPNAKNQTSAAAPTSAAASPADAATTQAIDKAFATFFSGTAAPSVSQQALQHGDAFKAVLEQQAKGQYSNGSSAKVTAIAMRGQVADVTFTISQKGAVLLPDIKGFAVQENGTWKVAAATFCLLLKLQGSPPAVCSDTSITALPS